MPSPSECVLKETEGGGRHSWKNPTNWRKKGRRRKRKKKDSYGTRCEKDGWLFISLEFSYIFFFIFFPFVSPNILSLVFAISSSSTSFSCSIHHRPLSTPPFHLLQLISSSSPPFFHIIFFPFLRPLLRHSPILPSLPPTLLLVKRQSRPNLTTAFRSCEGPVRVEWEEKRDKGEIRRSYEKGLHLKRENKCMGIYGERRRGSK